MPVAVITDSTACLPEQLTAQWGITVVQLQIQANGQIDDESRFDRAELVKTLRAGKSVATAPPDPGAFFWSFQDAVSAGADAIVSFHISRRLSATADAAREAARQVRVPVHVVDSATTGMSLGFAVLSAARAAAAGAGPQRIMEIARRRCLASKEFFYVDTLEYLRRGGRIGTATALLGNAFSIKPILTVQDGEIAPLAKIRGSQRALDKLLDLAVQHAGEQEVDIAVSGVTPSAREMTLVQQLRSRIPTLNDIMLTHIGTALTAHVGPGTLGITVAPVQ